MSERPETTAEHIARDMREGRFPDRSERQNVEDDGEQDAYFRRRLLADYSRLIASFEEGVGKAGETFHSWLTPADGKLILAALRVAREEAGSTP